MRPASSSSSSGTESRTSPSPSEMYAPPESSTLTLISAMPVRLAACSRAARAGRRTARQGGDEHVRERLERVDVLPCACRAEQDQREPDQPALERDPATAGPTSDGSLWLKRSEP